MENLIVEIYEILAGFGENLDDFKSMNFRKKNGESVAHIAAKYNNLPTDFDQWDMIDDSGRSVWDVYREYNL